MNYQQLIARLLKQIRGAKTQLDMSQDLGYNYNQYGKWESSQRKIRWREFSKLCKVSNIQLEKLLLIA
ncbi:MAG: helix-turn-helix transcriptional regulator [Bdellovibrionales bacterium]|nr:helix-turn-helix transcriptional regulator [Bdellovibrionales bacterium]